ncbi:hypothetical protein HV164_17855 [Citrobacter freundii]|jgi:hypothetical protein|uniref:Virulence effector protein n=1 Tax=Citrobacter freundii TaxID=546 RepID=A0ABD7B2R1_CITFR|nr:MULTISPECIES: SrfA family protein [Citrobacter]MBD0829617.1 hypothetical protein [Citrobacter sp. C1]QCA19670.1 hypothetical protein E5284_18145 [Citrobacter freundii]QLR74245.1 hypothetical protein HV337_17615 [Citrobacter freundii]QLX26702.1 hypothetical protein HV271_18665 [Citrobacter freundii]QLY38274.1 hypothetical protein HV164_17855 [Citrobacter freundii]
MRNSIQGPLLRSGHNSSFKALGETGYPVFKMAFQLREAIYRLDAGRDLARHLAIPQNDQGGDRTDWYSSFPGDVIPWSGASEAERESARQQFTAFQMAVQSLSEQLLNAEQSGTGGDRRVFAQLLKSVVNFPDYDFVYLVNGILVITFWGFVHSEGEQRNPMHWLSPSSVPATSLAATTPLAQADTIVTPAIAPVVETVGRTRRWSWRWLLWLLLALLLLALLLGLLRGCVPSLSLPGLPTFSSDKTAVVTDPVAERPSVNTSGVVTQVSRATTDTVVGTRAVPGVTERAAVGEHQTLESTPSTRPSDIPTTEVGSDAKLPQPVANDTAVGQPSAQVPPAVPDAVDAQTLPAVEPVTTPPAIPAQGEPLTLPATLPNGPAQFLNGEWRVNGGIQDKLSGRPLQLQYNFAQGNGTVSVRQSNGVTCSGPASGNVQQGALSITNPEQMKCSDGSNFIVPTIECKSPAAGHADCLGSNNGEKTFPIRMLQPNS